MKYQISALQKLYSIFNRMGKEGAALFFNRLINSANHLISCLFKEGKNCLRHQIGGWGSRSEVFGRVERSLCASTYQRE
jgi:hypothetical protein